MRRIPSTRVRLALFQNTATIHRDPLYKKQKLCTKKWSGHQSVGKMKLLKPKQPRRKNPSDKTLQINEQAIKIELNIPQGYFGTPN